MLIIILKLFFSDTLSQLWEVTNTEVSGSINVGELTHRDEGRHTNDAESQASVLSSEVETE